MVDLVKIRKKSKATKDAGESAASAEGHAVDRPIDHPLEQSAPEPAAREPGPELPAGGETELTPAALEREVVVKPEVAPPPPEPVVATKKPARDAAVRATAKAEPPQLTPPVEPTAAVPPPRVAVAEAGEPPDELDEAGEDRLARFKRLAGKRRSWTASARSVEHAEAEPGARAGLELLRFRVAGEDYAVDIEKIVEIVPPRATTRVPNADEAIVGIISLRGTIVTVIDLRRKLGHPKIDFRTLNDARMIVVERAGETAGFLVDRVSRVVKLDPSQLESHPIVSSAEQSEYVSGVFQAQDGLVILLDIERILAG